MTNFYISAAWVLTFGIVGGYALSIMIRGRHLSRVVAPDRRRWMDDRGELQEAVVANASAAAAGGGTDG